MERAIWKRPILLGHSMRNPTLTRVFIAMVWTDEALFNQTSALWLSSCLFNAEVEDLEEIGTNQYEDMQRKGWTSKWGYRTNKYMCRGSYHEEVSFEIIKLQNFQEKKENKVDAHKQDLWKIRKYLNKENKKIQSLNPRQHYRMEHRS